MLGTCLSIPGLFSGSSRLMQGRCTTDLLGSYAGADLGQRVDGRALLPRPEGSPYRLAARCDR